MFIKSFCKSQFLHISVNLSFTITDINKGSGARGVGNAGLPAGDYLEFSAGSLRSSRSGCGVE